MRSSYRIVSMATYTATCGRCVRLLRPPVFTSADAVAKALEFDNFCPHCGAALREEDRPDARS